VIEMPDGEDQGFADTPPPDEGDFGGVDPTAQQTQDPAPWAKVDINAYPDVAEWYWNLPPKKRPDINRIKEAIFRAEARLQQLQEMPPEERARAGIRVPSVLEEVQAVLAQMEAMDAGAGADPPVVAAIKQVTSDPRLQRAMMLGVALEGGSFGNDYGGIGGPGSGDGGKSVGPFQINFSPDLAPNGYRENAAGMRITPQEAADPVKAAQWMLPAYQAAAESLPPELWTYDPFQWALTVVFNAEKPLDKGGPVATYGDRARQAWLNIEQGKYATGTAPGGGYGAQIPLTPGQRAEAHAWGLSEEDAQTAIALGMSFQDYAALDQTAKDLKVPLAALLTGDYRGLSLQQTAAVMEKLGITDPAEFIAGIGVGLTGPEMRQIKLMGGDIVDWAEALKAGVNLGDLQNAAVMGYKPREVALALGAGASSADLQQWKLEGKTVSQGLGEVRRAAEINNRLEQTSALLSKQYAYLPETVQNDLLQTAKKMAAQAKAGLDVKLEPAAVIDEYLKSPQARAEEAQYEEEYQQRLERVRRSWVRAGANPRLGIQYAEMGRGLSPTESLGLTRYLEGIGLTQPALDQFKATLPSTWSEADKQAAVDRWAQSVVQQKQPEQAGLPTEAPKPASAYSALLTPPAYPPITEITTQQQTEQQKEEEAKKEKERQKQAQQQQQQSSSGGNVYAPAGGLTGAAPGSLGSR